MSDATDNDLSKLVSELIRLAEQMRLVSGRMAWLHYSDEMASHAIELSHAAEIAISWSKQIRVRK